MNWKVRLRNPVFWVQIVVSAFAAVLAYAGLTAADLTTWESAGYTFGALTDLISG